MADEKKTSEGSMRWWEFYAVRYAVGTIVGAVMLWLLFSLSPALRPLMLGPAEPNSTVGPLMKLDAGQLWMLGIGGLVFCYLASAPILVLHASRFLLVSGTVRLSRCWTWCATVVVPIALVLFLISETDPVDLRLVAPALLILLLLFIVGVQWVAGVLTLRNPKKMFAFYQRLARARVKADGGITDSYRHLREHGNSFFIVLLEVLLGLLLIGVGMTTGPKAAEFQMYVYIVIFVTWTLPAVSVWLAATLLEREFSQQHLSEAEVSIGSPGGATTGSPSVPSAAVDT